MNELKTTEAQRRANRNWEKKNPDKVKHDRAIRNVKSAIKNHASEDDLVNIERWVHQKQNGQEIK